MERELKSIAHATIANGIHIYIPTGNKNYIVGSRLVCAGCNEPWYMNLTECFICGAVNPFLYRCENCRAFSSITKASDKCSNCNQQETLHPECPNPQCPSNTNDEIHEAVNKMGGVFNKRSGFRISLQRCLNCGSQFHVYQIRKIIVFTLSSTKVDKTKLQIDDLEVLSTHSFIIFRIIENDKIKYAFFKLDEYLMAENNFELLHIYDDFGKVLDKIFSMEND